MKWKAAMGGLSALLVVIATMVSAGNASAYVDFRLARHHAGASIEVTCDEGSTFAKVIFRGVVLGAGTKAQRHAARHVFWTENACKAQEAVQACEYEREPFLCEEEPEEVVWREPHNPFGLLVFGFGNTLNLGLSFPPTRTIPLTEYRVTVKTIDAEEVRWLILRGTRNGRYVKIWEGTDAFVNYCINRSKEIRSKHGRLFCKKRIPSTGEEMMTWRFRPL